MIFKKLPPTFYLFFIISSHRVEKSGRKQPLSKQNFEVLSAECYSLIWWIWICLLRGPRTFLWKKNLPLFQNFHPVITFSVFGVRKSSWYLRLRTPRDLLISGEFFESGHRRAPPADHQGIEKVEGPATRLIPRGRARTFLFSSVLTEIPPQWPPSAWGWGYLLLTMDAPDPPTLLHVAPT